MEQERYKLIVTVVSKGKSGKVVDITKKAEPSAGGTILYGHGAAVRLMLGISIEPEKDVILTLVKADKALMVMKALEDGLELNEPHKGICFLLSVEEAIGIATSGFPTE